MQYITADVTDEDSVKAAVEFACAPTGGLDAVIANAGGGGGMAPPHMQDVTEFTRVLQLNVLGTLDPDEVHGAASREVGTRVVRRHVVDRG